MNLLLISSFVSCQLVAIYSAESCSLEENYAYYGNAIETDGYIWSDTIKTPQQCQQKCSETSGCKFFSWTHLAWSSAKPYLCALKHSNNGRTFSQGFISGPACKDADAAPSPASTAASDCKCGLAVRRTIRNQNRIVGGRPSEVNEYPWQVLLEIQMHEGPWCGGSLISSRWVLSAAHCFEMAGITAAGITVILGEHDTRVSSESESLRLGVERIMNHPDYNEKAPTDNDFSLLKLSRDIDFSKYEHIRPICLPTDTTNTYEGLHATVSGWGRTERGSGSNILLETEVKVISNYQCRNNHQWYYSQITDNMICAYDSRGVKDSCQGDSGGPLMVPANSGDGITPGQNYELIGVTSFGMDCGDTDFPGVYARVTEQLDWINRNAINGFETCPRE